MTTYTTLETLDIDDRVLLRLQVLFEEHAVLVDLEDDDDENRITRLHFEQVHAFFTNTPAVQVFPQTHIVTFQWRQLQANRFQADFFLDIRFSRSVLILTVVFESLHIRTVSSLSPSLLL